MLLPGDASMHCCREVAESQQASNGNQPALHHACLRAASSIRGCPCRVYSTDVLKKLNGVGSVICGVVKDSLWAQHPPEPGSADEEAAWKDYLSANVRNHARIAHCHFVHIVPHPRGPVKDQVYKGPRVSLSGCLNVPL